MKEKENFLRAENQYDASVGKLQRFFSFLFFSALIGRSRSIRNVSEFAGDDVASIRNTVTTKSCE